MARVLVVDDERSLRRTFGLFLRDDGHEVETTASVDEALAALERSKDGGQPFDVVVTDLLPQHASLSLMKDLSTRWPEIEVVLTTDEQTLESAISAIRVGAHAYISKPVTSTKLRGAVASAVKLKLARDEDRRRLLDKEQQRDELARRAAEQDQQCQELCQQLAGLGVTRTPASLARPSQEQPLLEPQPKRILVVDDERTLRRVFSMFLSDEGFGVETADNVDEGLAAIEQSYASGCPFAVVVSDIIMPRRSGAVLMEVVAERWPEIKLIIVTGQPTVETATLAVRTRVYEYMSKPVSSWMIRKVVSNALEVKAAQDEERQRASVIDDEIAVLAQHIEARTRELEALRGELAAAQG